MTLHVGLSYIIISLSQIFLKSDSTSQCRHLYCTFLFYMRWAGHMACMGERRGTSKILVGKPTGNRPLQNKCGDGGM